MHLYYQALLQLRTSGAMHRLYGAWFVAVRYSMGTSAGSWIVRMPYTGERYKEDARSSDGITQADDRFVERHALCFPWGQRPAKHQRELCPCDVVIDWVTNSAWESRHPCLPT